jgi:hypothetical protein
MVAHWFDVEDDKLRAQAAQRPIDLPHLSDVMSMWSHAWRVAIHFLGRDWAERELSATGRAGFLMVDRGHDSDESGEEGYIRAHRAQRLASGLLHCQHIAGFDALLSNLSNRSMHGALAEIDAIVVLSRFADGIRIIAPSGRKGSDYDAEILVGRNVVAVEIKAKAEMPADQFSESKVVNTLLRAKKQLPAGRPGLIYLTIPSPWATDDRVMRNIDRTVTTWLASTRRVNAVVLSLECRKPGTDKGMTFVCANYMILNDSPRVPVPNIGRAIR